MDRALLSEALQGVDKDFLPAMIQWAASELYLSSLDDEPEDLLKWYMLEDVAWCIEQSRQAAGRQQART